MVNLKFDFVKTGGMIRLFCLFCFYSRVSNNRMLKIKGKYKDLERIMFKSVVDNREKY